MSKKPKMGRPKLSSDEKKKPFPMRFSDREIMLFSAAADSKGESLREWMTNVLLRSAKKAIRR